MTCAYSPQGLADCLRLIKKAKAIILKNYGSNATPANFISLSSDRLVLAAAAGATGTVIDFKRGLDRTTDDPQIQASALGLKEKTMNSIPSYLGYAYIGAADYKTLQGAEDGLFSIEFILNDGVKMGTILSNGNIQGFTGRIALVHDGPASDNSQQAYRVYLFFDEWEEFKNFHVDKAGYNFSELKLSVPKGVSVSLNTAYTAGVLKLNAFKRGTKVPYNGFAAATNWKVLESSASDVAVTAATVVNGLCSITIKKDSSTTPVDLVAGERTVIQGTLDDGTHITFLSETFEVNP